MRGAAHLDIPGIGNAVPEDARMLAAVMRSFAPITSVRCPHVRQCRAQIARASVLALPRALWLSIVHELTAHAQLMSALVPSMLPRTATRRKSLTVADSLASCVATRDEGWRMPTANRQIGRIEASLRPVQLVICLASAAARSNAICPREPAQQ